MRKKSIKFWGKEFRQTNSRTQAARISRLSVLPLSACRYSLIIFLPCLILDSDAKPPRTPIQGIELGPMKQEDPAKFARAIKTVQDLDLKEQEAEYEAEIRKMGLFNSTFIVTQSLGWGGYLAKDRFARNVYHLTLVDDRLERGGIADGDVVALNFIHDGLFRYTDLNGIERTVRMLREVTLLPPLPKKSTPKKLEDRMKDGKSYLWETSRKNNDESSAKITYRLTWGEVREPRDKAAEQAEVSEGAFEGKLFRIQEYEWAKGGAGVRMIPKVEGLGVLSSISGRFLGGAEKIEVTTAPDGFWHLRGESHQWMMIKAMAIKPEGIQPFGTPRIVSWKSGDPAVRLIESRQGIACLSGVGGRLLAGGNFIRVRLDPDGWWYLEGSGPQSVSGMAIIVPWASDIPQPDVKTHNWNKGDAPIKMLHQDEGFCFLSGIGGGFNGGGERVSVYVGDDGFWYLHGTTLRSYTRGEAVSVKFGKGPLLGNPQLFGLESRGRWKTEGGNWQFHENKLTGNGKGRITLELDRQLPLTVEFKLKVVNGKRPRITVANTTLGNEGYQRTLALYPSAGVEHIGPEGNAYTLNKEISVTLRITENGVTYIRDGQPWQRRSYKVNAVPSIHFSSGDGWSEGTIEISDLSIK